MEHCPPTQSTEYILNPEHSNHFPHSHRVNASRMILSIPVLTCSFVLGSIGCDVVVPGMAVFASVYVLLVMMYGKGDGWRSLLSQFI